MAQRQFELLRMTSASCVFRRGRWGDSECAPRKRTSAQPSKATIERRAERRACPACTYRNLYGPCQPNETAELIEQRKAGVC
jgi:hypothetical protein